MKQHNPDFLGSTLPSDWVKRKLAQLQKEPAEFDQTPAAIDQFRRLLAKPAALSEEKEFNELLSLIINDTLQGIDISRHYPTFFEQLVTDMDLRETFLDALEILELSRAGELEPVPGAFSYDLSFLNKQPPQPLIEITESGGWHVVWQQTAAQIEPLFITDRRHTDDMTFRGAYNWLEEERIILLQDEVTLDEEQCEILLEATRPVGRPDQLNLSLLVAAERLPSAAIQAYIQWGSYKASSTLNKYGLGLFPPLPLSTILDRVGEKIVADLQLEIISAY